MTLGGKIKALRGYMPQAAIAREIGVTNQAVWEWENDVAQPRPENLVKLAACLKTTVDDLLGDGRKPTPAERPARRRRGVPQGVSHGQ